ncbi:Alpha/beta hydrolase fold-3 [Dillenia turbinata]|uniref:Alpha/beta hydrolase fold-3 n=1 Tax=Dillenia turbinata TaxID=194707 RepID=A0AAN8W5R9_9MAGN
MVFEDGTVDRTWRGPPEYKFLTTPVPPHQEFIDGVLTRDVIIDPIRGTRVRIYIPETDKTKLALMVHFHACDDAYSALLWLQNLARGESAQPWLQTHADFERIFLIGDSTGGNLVHQVAARAGKDGLEPVRLAGGIMLHPGLPEGSNKDHPITCPMGAAAPPLTEEGLPAMLLVVAEMDLLKDSELDYHEAMKKAGKEIELLINQGMEHSFYLNKIAVDNDQVTAARFEQLISEIINFMNRH